MSVTWEFMPNEAGDEIFCPHCSDFTEGPFFTSDPDYNREICLRCVRVLSKLYGELRAVRDIVR